MELKTKLSLDQIRDEKNIASLLSEDDLDTIGRQCHADYMADEQSRRDWLKSNEDANDLALQVSKAKSFPWPNASNVKFPLLTIGALQFHARAYPALVKSPNLVKYRVQGSDPDGQKAARASRISSHMSYQFLEEDEQWEEDQDRLLLVVPIAGCAFKKTYYSPTKGHNCSRTVLPKNLVVHYYANTVEDAQRKTEILPLYNNQIRARELKGTFIEYRGDDGYPKPQMVPPDEIN